MLGNITIAAGDTATLEDVIVPYLPVFAAAFVVSLVFTPLMRRLALANGVVDRPDHGRKVHCEPVAYMGGVAIFLGWITGVVLSYFLTPHNADLVGSWRVSFPMSIILGAGAITLTGLFDDVYGISPRVKVGGQLFAAAALASEKIGLLLVVNSLKVIGFDAPAPVATIGDPASLAVYILGAVVITIFVLGGCNATNLMDGLDGLAAGVTGIAAAGFLAIAAIVALDSVTNAGSISVVQAMHQDPARIVMCLAIIGGVLGFLPYNFNPASIFMGDAGSLLLGYLSVTTMLMFASSQDALLIITACLIVFALPIADTMLAILRRKLRGVPMSTPDKEHLHHLLRRSGLSVKQSVLVMYGAGLLFASLGVAMVAMGFRWRYVLLAFFVIYGVIFVGAFQYGRRLSRHDAAASPTSAATEPAVVSAAAPPPPAPTPGASA